jgi:hypothetical protein
MGFANHGGMWGDLVLLPMANAVIVPHLTAGLWIAAAVVLSTAVSIAVHMFWYHPLDGDGATAAQSLPRSHDAPDAAMAHEEGPAVRRGDHMWPAHVHGTWARDLSWSGWAHVVYVAGELALLAGFAVHAMPPDVVLFVATIFTVHVPIGLLQPRWYRTGHIATVSEQPLLAPLLAMLWAVTLVKM